LKLKSGEQLRNPCGPRRQRYPVLALLYAYFFIEGQYRPVSRRASSPHQSYLNSIFDD